MKRSRESRPVHHELGVVTVVQEGRFRLSSDDGRSLLFALDRRAPLEPQDLPPLLTRRVMVTYTEVAGRNAFSARDVCRAGTP